MKKNKILMVLLVVIVILLIFVIVKLNKKDDLSNVVIYDPIIPPVMEQMEIEKGKLQYVNDKVALLNARQCLGSFYMQCGFLKSSYYDENNDSVLRSIYSMLSNEYKEFGNVSIESIKSKIDVCGDPVIEIYEIYSLTNFEGVNNYVIHGGIRNFKTNELKEFNNILSLDTNENTFEIYLDDYVNSIVDVSNINVNDEINFNIKETIEDRGYNHYTAASSKTEAMMRDYTQMIKNLLIYNPEIAYTKVDESSNIKSIEQLKQFVNDNKNQLYSLAYGTHEVVSVNMSKGGYRIYDNNKNFCLSIYFDSYSTFSFDIEKF